MKLRRASEIENPKSLILMHGPSGAGKTYRAAQAVDPSQDKELVFLVLTEANGVVSAKTANPNVLLPEFEAADGTVRNYVSNANELRQCMKMCAGTELKDMGVTTVAFDGLTEIQALLKDEILAKKPADQGETMQLQEWGLLGERMRKIMRWLRSIPYNVIVTCLTNEEGGGDSGDPLRIRLQLQGKSTVNAVPQFFTAVAYCTNIDPARKGQPVRRIAMFEGSSRYVCKPAGPLGGIREDAAYNWFQILSGKVVDSE
jgi:hypothetical protein